MAADDVRVIATGYGRVAVPYAHKVVTEITCHGTGAVRLFGDHGTVIDVGGQDTKVIQIKGGRVAPASPPRSAACARCLPKARLSA